MVDAEGLRLGMFVGGVVMAAFPVMVGVGLVVFLLKEYRNERGSAGADAAPADAAERS